MRLVLVCEIRRWVADPGLQCDQCWLPGVFTGAQKGVFNRIQVVALLAKINYVPAVASEPHRYVITAREVSRTVNCDLVVVENRNQVIQLLVPSKRSCFVADALHQAPIAHDHVGVMVGCLFAERRTQVPLGKCHSNCVGETLSQRARCYFNPCGVTYFWMAWCARTPLAKTL